MREIIGINEYLTLFLGNYDYTIITITLLMSVNHNYYSEYQQLNLNQ